MAVVVRDDTLPAVLRGAPEVAALAVLRRSAGPHRVEEVRDQLREKP
ncbi:hypothetical protein [Streptomyces sp. WM6378]|nr:hypothetical protein [Streptomyces sp. WM6378]